MVVQEARTEFVVHTQFGTYPIEGTTSQEAEEAFRKEWNHSGGLTIETMENFLKNQGVK